MLYTTLTKGQYQIFPCSQVLCHGFLPSGMSITLPMGNCLAP